MGSPSLSAERERRTVELGAHRGDIAEYETNLFVTSELK